MNAEALRLDYFFQGTLSREGSASALIATLLAHRPDFRRFLAQKIEAPVEWFDPPGETPRVAVEDDNMDIRLDSPRAVVLIENKIRASSAQGGQLRRYYERACKALATADERAVCAVYLAPGGMGESEIEDVENCEEFRTRGSRDRVSHVSWETLLGFEINGDARDQELIKSGLDAVSGLIEQAKQDTYPLEGGREKIDAVVRDSRDRLRARLPRIKLATWRARHEHQLYTTGIPILWTLSFHFEAADEPPFHPRDIMKGDRLSLGLRSSLSLTQKVKATDPAYRAWDALTADGFIDVPGVGRHEPTEQNQYAAETCIDVPVDIANRAADVGEAVFNALMPYPSLIGDRHQG